MRMTRLEWRYLQKIALDHPYFDTHKLPLTEKEAKAIVEASNTMTGREFVDSIYAKLSMTRPEEKKDRFAWLHQIGEQFAVPPIRRIAIAVLVVILMTVFFAATPTGRAIADSVVRYIATLFEDGRLVVNRSDNEAPSYAVVPAGFEDINAPNYDSATTHIVYVNSVEKFIKDTGKIPVAFPLPYESMCYEFDDELDYLKVNTIYMSKEGQIILYQIWNEEILECVTTTGYNLYDGDQSIYYSIEEDKGYINCLKIYEDSIVVVVSHGKYTLDELIKLLIV